MATEEEGWFSGKEFTEQAQGLAFEFTWAVAHIGNASAPRLR